MAGTSGGGVPPNKPDAGNSTTATLAGSATWTGTAVDVSAFGGVLVQLFSDVAGKDLRLRNRAKLSAAGLVLMANQIDQGGGSSLLPLDGFPLAFGGGGRLEWTGEGVAGTEDANVIILVQIATHFQHANIPALLP